jgi:hypothetical protein
VQCCRGKQKAVFPAEPYSVILAHKRISIGRIRISAEIGRIRISADQNRQNKEKWAKKILKMAKNC